MNDLKRADVIKKLEWLEQLANTLVSNPSQSIIITLAGEIRTYIEELKGVR
jgi:hypothetical protein